MITLYCGLSTTSLTLPSPPSQVLLIALQMHSVAMVHVNAILAILETAAPKVGHCDASKLTRLTEIVETPMHAL